MGKSLCLQLYTHKETQKEKCERKQGNSEKGMCEEKGEEQTFEEMGQFRAGRSKEKCLRRRALGRRDEGYLTICFGYFSPPPMPGGGNFLPMKFFCDSV